MPKKSSKSTRRSRAKKQEVTKKKPAAPKAATATVIAEGSDEPVVKVEQETPVRKSIKKSATKKASEPLEEAHEVIRQERDFAEQIVQPTRTRMLVSAFALGVIIIALIFGAGIIHQQSANKQASESVKSGQDSGKADQILQSGGNVCTNGNTQTDTTGSSNPQSVGMMLQSNPVNTIQTPQTVGNGADVNTLQGASCF